MEGRPGSAERPTDATIKHRQDAMWSKLGAQLGNMLRNRSAAAREIAVLHDGQQVILDFDEHAGYRSQCVHTRLRAPLPRSPLRLRVFHQELVHAVGRLFGMQDVQVGDERFDQTFVIQANDAALAQRLFQDADVRRGMIEEPELEVNFGPPHGITDAEEQPDTDALSLEVPGEIDDEVRLRRLFDLFVHLLHRLHMTAAHAG